jgi:crotonobetainyl-CoA:carnitine CoA-transferase CaiB-like acyl-CoA transferase
VVQALIHRDRAGEGQYVDTSIMYAHMLNTSMAWKSVDGACVGDRPRLDHLQLGWGPLYRLYATANDSWLCIAVVDDDQWRALCDGIGRTDLVTEEDFATPAARKDHATELAAVLEASFASKPADVWFTELDQLGVPCEVTTEDRVAELFDDPDLREKRWIVSYEHPVVGRMDVAGLLVDLSETPGRLAGPPPMVGQHTREILDELGYDKETVDDLLAAGVTAEWAP